MDNPIDVNTDTFRDEIKPTKKSIRKVIFLKSIYLTVGILISCLLYFKCMYSTTCNSIVVIYISVLGLACFINFGLPVEKVINKEIFKQ